MKCSVSVIVTTYNRPDALERVLDALAKQTVPFTEILVADDGSTEATKQTIERCAQSSAVPIHHVWHEDKGFRAAAIRNRALAQATGTYVIFLDGDCVPRADFVARHVQLARPGWWVSGNRVLLSRAFTEAWLAGRANHGLAGWSDWLRGRLCQDLNRILPLIYLPGMAWRERLAHRWEGAKTCNLAAWKEDLMAVNGFEESFEGWGFEDSDLAIRLMRRGARRLDGRYATGVFHLWHPENDRSQSDRNWQRLQEVLASAHTRARHGVDGRGQEEAA